MNPFGKICAALDERGLRMHALAVAREHSITLGEMLSPARAPTVVHARHVFFEHLYRVHRWSMKEIGGLFGLDPTTVLYGLRALKKEREGGAVARAMADGGGR